MVPSAGVNSPVVPGGAVSVVGPIADPVDVVDVVPCCSDSAPVVELVPETVPCVPAEVVVPGLLVPVALTFWLVLADWPGIEAPPRYCCGFCACPPTRVSKCRCGPVQLPVQPT